VEYADEPYTGMLLPMVAHTGKLDQQFAGEWLATYFCELFNDLLLLRRANFRPEDLSSIWTKKQPQEIFWRLTRLNTRHDVEQYARENCSKLIVTLSQCLPFIKFIMQSLPGAKTVHVVRKGYDVAGDVEAKKWFSDEQLLRPKNAQLYRKYEYAGSTWHLPWWVDEGEEKYFLSLSDFERGLYYWWALMKKGSDALRECDCNEILVHYEDLLDHPEEVFKRVCRDLELTPGPLSGMKLAEIRANSSINPPAIEPRLKKRVQDIYLEVGYL